MTPLCTIATSATFALSCAWSQPSIPPPAARAGFTTLALDFDATHQLPSHWLGGCNVAGNGDPVNHTDVTGFILYQNIFWSHDAVSCITTQVQDDPLYGSGLVVDMPWVATTVHPLYLAGNSLTTLSPNYQDDPSSYPGATFPYNVYIEVEARSAPILPAITMSLFTWLPSDTNVEIDVVETDAGRGLFSAAIHNHITSDVDDAHYIWNDIDGPAHLPKGFDPSAYHRWGVLSTSDGTNLKACSYVDDRLMTCQLLPSGLTAGEQTQRMILILGNACDLWNQVETHHCQDGLTQHLYLRKLRVFSCASWVTSQCNRTL